MTATYGVIASRAKQSSRCVCTISGACFGPSSYHIPLMADEPITLEFLACQQQRLLDEMGSMRDDMQVLTAMVMRLDGTVGLVSISVSPTASAVSRKSGRSRNKRDLLEPEAAPRLIEGQHRAGDFAGFHRAEGFVDVAETAALGHHVVEVEAALAVEFEIGRDVGAEAVGAHPRGLHLAL